MKNCITIAELDKLRPCAESGRRVRALLRKLNADKAHCFTAAEAVAAGCGLDDLIWVASAVAQRDEAVERRLRLWLSDCAARVLHLYERAYPNDERVRDAIKASRDYANGRIDAAAWVAARGVGDAARDAARATAWAAAWAARAAAWAAAWAARAAAWAAAWGARDAARGAAWDAARGAAWAARVAARGARDAEEQWQLQHLVAWLSDPEPKPLRLPARPKAEKLAA